MCSLSYLYESNNNNNHQNEPYIFANFLLNQNLDKLENLNYQQNELTKKAEEMPESCKTRRVEEHIS